MSKITSHNMQSVTSNAVYNALLSKNPVQLFNVSNNNGSVAYYKASGMIPISIGESVYFFQARQGELIIISCGHGDGQVITAPKAKRLLNVYSKIAGLRYANQSFYFSLSSYSHECIMTRMCGTWNESVVVQAVSVAEYSSATEITIET